MRSVYPHLSPYTLHKSDLVPPVHALIINDSDLSALDFIKPSNLVIKR